MINSSSEGGVTSFTLMSPWCSCYCSNNVFARHSPAVKSESAANGQTQHVTVNCCSTMEIAANSIFPCIKSILFQPKASCGGGYVGRNRLLPDASLNMWSGLQLLCVFSFIVGQIGMSIQFSCISGDRHGNSRLVLCITCASVQDQREAVTHL